MKTQRGRSGACLLAQLLVVFTICLKALKSLGWWPARTIALRGQAITRAIEPSLNAFTTGTVFQSRIHDFLHISGAHKGSLGMVRSCPCCGSIVNRVFDTFNTRPDAQCPTCLALERHRRVCAVFGGPAPYIAGTKSPRDWFSVPIGHQRPFRLLSFGPQPQMERELTNMTGIVDHISLDSFAPGYKYSGMTLQADVSDLSFPASFADGIIILHVLEHVPQLQNAIIEIGRVIRKATGWALIEVPCWNLKAGTLF